MLVYVIFLLPILAAGKPQFMNPMQQHQFPYYPQPQGQPMMNMQQQMPNMQGMMPAGMQPQMLSNMPQLPRLPNLPGMQQLQQMNMPPMQLPMNSGRLPMVVMPHHSKKKDNKKKAKSKGKPKKSKKRNHKRHKSRSSSEESCSSESGYEYRSKTKRSLRKNRHQVLTPVVSYLTKDGYVVYQKKIKKDKARDWLELSKGKSEEQI